jgi:hypothetical protein
VSEELLGFFGRGGVGGVGRSSFVGFFVRFGGGFGGRRGGVGGVGAHCVVSGDSRNSGEHHQETSECKGLFHSNFLKNQLNKVENIFRPDSAFALFLEKVT